MAGEETLLWVIKAFRHQRHKDWIFMGEFVCRLVSTPCQTMSDINHDELARFSHKFTYMESSLTGEREVFKGLPAVNLQKAELTLLTLDRRPSVLAIQLRKGNGFTFRLS